MLDRLPWRTSCCPPPCRTEVSEKTMFILFEWKTTLVWWKRVLRNGPTYPLAARRPTATCSSHAAQENMSNRRTNVSRETNPPLGGRCRNAACNGRRATDQIVINWFNVLEGCKRARGRWGRIQLCVACWGTQNQSTGPGNNLHLLFLTEGSEPPCSPPVGPGCDASPPGLLATRAVQIRTCTPHLRTGFRRICAWRHLHRWGLALRVDGSIEPGSANPIGSDRLASSRKCRRSSTSRRNFHNSSRPCQLWGLFYSRNATWHRNSVTNSFKFATSSPGPVAGGARTCSEVSTLNASNRCSPSLNSSSNLARNAPSALDNLFLALSTNWAPASSRTPPVVPSSECRATSWPRDCLPMRPLPSANAQLAPEQLERLVVGLDETLEQKLAAGCFPCWFPSCLGSAACPAHGHPSGISNVLHPLRGINDHGSQRRTCTVRAKNGLSQNGYKQAMTILHGFVNNNTPKNTKKTSAPNPKQKATRNFNPSLFQIKKMLPFPTSTPSPPPPLPRNK